MTSFRNNLTDMPSVNVTLDVGAAAMNAKRVLWKYSSKSQNVIIHLGDFYFMKENFGVIGKTVKGSGFRDIIFQAGVCSTLSQWALTTTVHGQSTVLFQKLWKDC